MTDQPDHAPADYAAIEVYLTIDGAAKALEWYGEAFGARTDFTMPTEDGKRIMHATISLFGGQVMLSDVISTTEPESDHRVDSPLALGGISVTTHINLPDAASLDAAVARAEKAGATVTMKPADMFWGARYARLRDPFGHGWGFSSPPAKSE